MATKTSSDIASAAVQNIVNDINNRAGLRRAFQDIPRGTQDEMISRWKSMIEREIAANG